MYITAQGCRLRNDQYCVEWDVKLYYTILYYTTILKGQLLYLPSLLEVFLLHQLKPFFLFPVSQLFQLFAVFSQPVERRGHHRLRLVTILLVFVEQQVTQPYTTSTFILSARQRCMAILRHTVCEEEEEDFA